MTSIQSAAPPDPPPYPAALPRDRAENLRRGRIVLAQARDALGRAGRPALHRIVDGAEAAMRTLAGRLVARSLNTFEWWQQSIRQLVTRHFAGALALTGGTGPGLEAIEGLEARIDRQAGFLARFRGAIALGAVKPGPGLIARAGNYGRAVWSVAQNVYRQVVGDRGARERRVLGAAEHHCDTCPYLAGLGWQPVGTLPEIGDSPCQTNCRCYFEVKGQPAEPPPTVADAAAEAGVSFVKAYAASGDKVVVADLAALAASLALDPATHIGPLGSGVSAKPGAYANFVAFLARAQADGTAVEMPRVGLDATGEATVIDGRHRLAVFLDRGLRALPVTVDPAAAMEFRRRFGAR